MIGESFLLGVLQELEHVQLYSTYWLAVNYNGSINKNVCIIGKESIRLDLNTVQEAFPASSRLVYSCISLKNFFSSIFWCAQYSNYYWTRICDVSVEVIMSSS